MENHKNNWDNGEQSRDSQHDLDALARDIGAPIQQDKNQFDYDWDEEVKKEKLKHPSKPKRHPSAAATTSRVPLGGMPYADPKYNNGYADKTLERSLAKAGKNLLDNIGP
jgi:hypothetical protein